MKHFSLHRGRLAVFMTAAIMTAALVPSAYAQTDDAAAAGCVPTHLRYRGVHFGDHPTTTYESTLSVETVRRDGRTLCQAEYREVHDGDRQEPPRAGWSAELDLTLGRVVQESFAVEGRLYGYALTFGEALVRGVAQVGADTVEVTVPLERRIDAGLFSLDLYLAYAPLSDDYAEEVHLLDTEAFEQPLVRPFRLSVERRQPYELEGTAVEAYRLRVEPLDDKSGSRGTYLVRVEHPHWVMRKEYVSHAESTERWPKSTGTDALVAIRCAGR